MNSLFSDARSLIIGWFAGFMTVIIGATRTGEPILFAFAAAVMVVSGVRAWDFYQYSKRGKGGPLTAEERRSWERRYVAGAAAHVGLLGVFCLATFILTDDPFVQLFSFSLTIAYLIGVSGRNFSSNTLVTAQTLAAGVPMTLALLWEGGLYYTIFAFVLLPFFLSLRFISARLRAMLLSEVHASRNNKALAERFDTALNNMPQGLAMFDAEGRALVINNRFQQILHLPFSPDEAIGQQLTDLLGSAARAGTMLTVDASRLADDLRAAVGGAVQVTAGDHLTLAFFLREMADGGTVVMVEDITERRNAELKIVQLARFDQLTGLPNRTYFHDQTDLALSSAAIAEGGCALLFIDLDDFKQVNDTLGHPTGDRLLSLVADRLRKLVSASHLVARFGGDEFVILQPVSRQEDAAELAGKVTASLSEPYLIDNQKVVIGASIGIALAPDHGTDTDRLLRAADMALYRAKASRKGTWRFFAPEMDVQAQARRDLELELRNAIKEQRLELFYQPLYNLRSKRYSSCEALIRWRDPVRGMISPGEFIPIAEETGLIMEISEFVLHEACRECLRWPANTRVSVNLSPLQFRQGDVVKSVADALAASGLAPERLEVEITESVLLRDDHSTREALHALHQLGVRLALDDFGTGYSSLSYMHSFPLDKVKIDRSFLRGLGSSNRTMVLLRGVAALSSQLGMSVVVEGIETEEQLALVSRTGDVDEVQGYLFSMPIPKAEIRELLYAAERQQVA